MFDRLSNLIIKKPWAVIAVWVIILIVSVPLALSLDGRLHYDITSFIPKNMESYQANDLYSQQFPNASQSQIIVAVESDNKTQAMLFIRELNDTVARDPGIHNSTGTTSIYDIQNGALTEMAPTLHDGLHELYNTATKASAQLYDARSQVVNASSDLYHLYDSVTGASSQMNSAYDRIKGTNAQLYSARDQVVAGNDGLYQIKDAADLVYGIPGYYAQAWGQIRPGVPDDATADAQAMQLTRQNVVDAIGDPNMKALATQYLSQFNDTWTVIPGADPAARAQSTIDAMAAPFFAAAPLDATKRQVINDLLGLKLSGYGNAVTLKSFIVDHAMAYQGLTSANDRARLSAIYDLGKSPSTAAIDSFTLSLATAGLSDADAASAREIYALGRGPSDDIMKTYIIGKAADGRNETERLVINDAWNLRHGTAQDFDNYVIRKASEGRNASEIWQIKEIYALGNHPSDQVIDTYVLNKACEGRNETESEVIRELYALGRSPGDNALKNYTVDKVADSLDISGSLSFFHALLDMDANASEDETRDFATGWAYTHDYSDPQLFSDAIVNQLVSGNLTLFAVVMDEQEASKVSHDAVKAIRSDVDSLTGKYPGLNAYVTGMSAIGVDTETAAAEDVGNIDKISVVLILVILGVYFLSILTPFVPLAVIGAAIVTGFGALYLSSYTVDLYYLTKTFMIVVMLGAGTDYCVFILSRYAEERSMGVGVAESVKFAIEHAGKSILCSGLTAMIGFASLMVIDNGMFRSMGQSMAIAILVSMLVAMTLIPAVLMLAGDRLFWPRKIYNVGRKTSRIGGAMKAISRSVVRHPGVVLAITILLAVPAVWLYFQMEQGQDLVSMLPDRLESKVGFNLLEDNFGSGNIDKANIIVTLPEPIRGPDGNYSMSALDRVERVSSIAASVQGVDRVYSMTRPDGELISYANMSAYSELQRAYYQNTMDNDTGTDGHTTVISVVFQGSPYSPESNKAIDLLRENLAAYTNGEGRGTTVAIGGTGAMSYDFQKLASGKFGLVIALVFAGIFIVLAALLRSALTPVKLFVSLLMGIVWTLAAFTIVFQYWLGDAVIWILPIVLFCTLMGLGGDYVVFMMSRVREEIEKGKNDEEAILSAVEVTGPVILLCGLVMAAAFGSMMISDMAELKEFGFVLSLAIILDATLMVLVLIPSIMMVARKYNWWLPFSQKRAMMPEIEKKQ